MKKKILGVKFWWFLLTHTCSPSKVNPSKKSKNRNKISCHCTLWLMVECYVLLVPFWLYLQYVSFLCSSSRIFFYRINVCKIQFDFLHYLLFRGLWRGQSGTSADFAGKREKENTNSMSIGTCLSHSLADDQTCLKIFNCGRQSLDILSRS